jgi:leader peptidase (prepilin peptidase) / N-methyltransferase
MLLFPIFYSLLGLVIGSFLNVCIYRIPRRESIVLPKSHCPKCGKNIQPYDNVPVFSYILLRGKCRNCKAAISLQYPVVEILNGLAYLACALSWGLDSATYVNSLFLSAILALIFIDYHHQILPNVITLPGTVAGIALSLFQMPDFYRDVFSSGIASMIVPDDPDLLLPLAGSVFGALLSGGLLLLVAFTYQITRKKQGLGMGDIKMMAMVGAFLGWRLGLLTILLGSLTGSIVGIFLIIFQGKNLQTRLAFGTFLGPGAIAALFFGLTFLHWYTLGL